MRILLLIFGITNLDLDAYYMEYKKTTRLFFNSSLTYLSRSSVKQI